MVHIPAHWIPVVGTTVETTVTTKKPSTAFVLQLVQLVNQEAMKPALSRGEAMAETINTQTESMSSMAGLYAGYRLHVSNIHCWVLFRDFLIRGVWQGHGL